MTFDVRGMTCAACSAHVEKSVQAVDGVRSVSVSLLSNSMEVDFDADKCSVDSICAAVASGGYSASVKGQAASMPARDEAKDQLRRLIVSVVLLILQMYVGMGAMLHLPVPSVLQGALVSGLVQLILTVAVILIHRSLFISGFKALIYRAPNMNSLICIGSAASFVFSLTRLFSAAAAADAGTPVSMTEYYFDSAAMIPVLISVGKYLEARAKGRTSEAISRLIDLAPKFAMRVENGKEISVPVSALRVGDTVRVREGQTVPTDGIILEGHGVVDQSMLTGESLPIDLTVGDAVTGATVNRGGAFLFRVTKVGEDTALAKIIRLVEAAANSKAPISRLADKVSGVFVPTVIGIAAFVFVLWLLLGATLSEALHYSISVMVISCPCALGLATPTAIMVGTGKGAEYGIMIRSAAALETAHAVNCVAFDKTGTLTEGRMRVKSIYAANADEALRLTAAVEHLSTHPIAKAIVEAAEQKSIVLPVASDYENIPGKGLTAVVEGATIRVGHAQWLRECGIDLSKVESRLRERADLGETVMCASKDGKLLAAFSLADTLRADSVQAVAELKSMGVHTVMLTGDNARTAKAFADVLGIDEVHAELLPSDKQAVIRQLQQQNRKVMMVGDGINDAPALVQADLGAAVGKGTDVAIESADIVFMNEEAALAGGAIRLGKAVIRNIRQNLFWAFFYNCIGIPVAAGALSGLGIALNPMIAATAMSVSSVFVITNALRLKGLKLIQSSVPQAKPDKETTNIIKEEIPMKKTVHIEGMMCKHCVAHVANALKPLDPEVVVELSTNSATIDANVSDEAIKTAVTEAGYEVVGIE